ncbi:hypothetical protein, partial [Sphingomonas sp. PAMC 26605]|uniref:hypothetical protein n=1 Tax=Sphingomonas sp. PAMC 26605 TaxID=1112214 RepID=UPI00026CB0FB
MAIAAHLPIVADRAGACVRTVRFVGLDLRAAAMRLQVRLKPDTPGAPLVDLNIAAADVEGLSLAEFSIADGVPTSTVQIRIAEATMKDDAKVPYIGELGDAAPLAYDLIATIGGDKRRLIFGEFVALATVNGADGAPASRPEGGGSRSQSWSAWSNASVSVLTDVAQVSIDGLDQLAPIVATATDAADRAEAAEAGAVSALETRAPKKGALFAPADGLPANVGGYANFEQPADSDLSAPAFIGVIGNRFVFGDGGAGNRGAGLDLTRASLGFGTNLLFDEAPTIRPAMGAPATFGGYSFDMRPADGSALSGDVFRGVIGNRYVFYDYGAGNNGFGIDLTRCLPDVGSNAVLDSDGAGNLAFGLMYGRKFHTDTRSVEINGYYAPGEAGVANVPRWNLVRVTAGPQTFARSPD